MWLADQFGHICIGIILSFIATALCGWVMARLGFATRWKYDTGIWPRLDHRRDRCGDLGVERIQ